MGRKSPASRIGRNFKPCMHLHQHLTSLTGNVYARSLATPAPKKCVGSRLVRVSFGLFTTHNAPQLRYCSLHTGQS